MKNSRWDILFSMPGQALVGRRGENVKYDRLRRFNFRIDRGVDENGLDTYGHSFTVKKFFPEKDWPGIEKETDEKTLEKFGECSGFLCGLAARFIEDQGANIPNDWNHFSSGLDSLPESREWGEWICSSDGYMNLGYYDDRSLKYEHYVECM